MRIIALSLLFTVCHLSVAQIDDDFIYKSELQRAKKSLNLKKYINEEQSGYNLWDLTYNKLSLHVNPEQNYVEGAVQFQFSSKTNNLNHVTIDLTNDLNIDSIISGVNHLNYQHQNDQVTVNLINGLNPSETDSFTVYYHGVPPFEPNESFTQGYHSGGIPVIYTLSEPYGAKDWWPCKQSLADKIDSLDVIITLPEKYQAASNGILVNDTVFNSTRINHWKHRHPIATYLVFFSATQYETYSDWASLQDGSQVEILNYIYPSSLSEAKRRTPLTANLIRLYSDLFIDYPFKNEKYGHAQFGWGGGMEHQTMSSMGGFGSELIAHELAHQWFGDYITCRSWHDIWLNEGFATYLTGLFLEHLNPDPWWRLWREILVDKITSEPGGSVYVKDTTDVGRIFDSRLTYRKGAYVLHMLRGQLGDSSFYRGIKKYINDYRVINGFATTDIFRENMEVAADTFLTEFFNDWIYGEGYPVYQADIYYSSENVLVNLSQSPSLDYGPFFEMKVPLSIYSSGQKDVIWLDQKQPDQSFNISTGYLPDSILINEDLWIAGKFKVTYHPSDLKVNKGIVIVQNKELNYLYVEVANEIDGIITIYNISGQKLIEVEWNLANKTISTSGLLPGVYMLQFSNEGVIISSKFIIR